MANQNSAISKSERANLTIPFIAVSSTVFLVAGQTLIKSLGLINLNEIWLSIGVYAS